MRHHLLAAIGLAFAVILASPLRADELAELREMVRDLQERVARLEAKLGDFTDLSTPAAPSGPVVAGVQVVRVLQIDPVPADSAAVARAEALRVEASKLEERAKQHDRDRAGLRDNDRNSSGTSNTHRREELKRQADDLRDDARRRTTEAMRIERDVSTPRHRIAGGDGVKLVLLTTERDLTSVIGRLAAGDVVAWQGLRRSSSPTLDEVTTSSVRRLDPPPAIAAAPAQLVIPPVVQQTATPPGGKPK